MLNFSFFLNNSLYSRDLCEIQVLIFLVIQFIQETLVKHDYFL